MDMVNNDIQVVCKKHAQLVLRDPKCAKKYPPHQYTNRNNYKARWIHGAAETEPHAMFFFRSFSLSTCSVCILASVFCS